MRKMFALLAVSGLLIAMVAAPAGAKSDARPFKAFMTGEMFWEVGVDECVGVTPEAVRSNMDATGRVSHLGHSTMTGRHCTPAGAEYGPSVATLVAANGDEVYMKYHGECPPFPELGEVLTCSFEFEVDRGTGRFADATGEGSGTLSIVWLGPVPSAPAWWTWTGTIGYCLAVLFGEVVLDDAGGGCPSERSVGSVVIVEVDEPGIRVGAFGF